MGKKSENAILILITLVQFINVLDFMMVMPMGPDFSLALNIPLEKLGFIGGSYTLAAAFSGVVGAFFLDRFDRKNALFIAITGLAVATLAGGLATGFYSLLATRVLAGMFAGPASSLTLSIVADIVPVERRGKAMGFVMTAFPLASIFGVPAGLELARYGGWWFPFFFIGGLCVMMSILCLLLLPSLRGHLNAFEKDAAQWKHFKEWKYYFSFVTTGLAVFSTFLLVPNLSAYIQFNLNWPREHMGALYLAGGGCTLFTTRLGGMWIDRQGSFPLVVVSTLMLCSLFLSGFIFTPLLQILPIPVFFAFFMVSNSLRFVGINTINSKVPPPHLRARFMSTVSATQHIMSSLGAFVAAHFLSTESYVDLKSIQHQRLVGIPFVATIAFCAAFFIPFLIFRQEKLIQKA